MSVDSRRRRGITAAAYTYAHTSEYNNITGRALSARGKEHARERPMHDQSYLGGERRLSSAAEAETIQRLFIGPERARCCVAGNVERKRPRDNRASSSRPDERAERAARSAHCYAFSSSRDHLGDVVLAVTSWPLVSHDILKRTVI